MSRITGPNQFQAEMDIELLKEMNQLDRDPKRMSKARMLAKQKAAELLDIAEDEDDQEEDAQMVSKGYRSL